MEVSGQELNFSRSSDLRHSCGNMDPQSTAPGQASNVSLQSSPNHGSWNLNLTVPWWELLCIILFYFALFSSFLGPHLWYMKVPSLTPELELQLLIYTTATAMPDPSCVCDLHHSSWQHKIINSLSKARDWTGILTDASCVRYCCATTENSFKNFFFLCLILKLEFIHYQGSCLALFISHFLSFPSSCAGN